MRKWQLRCNITQTAMQSFLSIAPELGINDLPKDWRTVMKYSIQGSDAGLSEVWKTTEVCGHCFLISFLETDLQNLPRCDDCGISRITSSATTAALLLRVSEIDPASY